MNTWSPWQVPAELPDDVTLDTKRDIVRIAAPNSGVPRDVATPVITTELQPLVLPAANVVFSPHPAGPLELFARAERVLHAASSPPHPPFRTEIVTRLRGEIWTAARDLYAPGAAIRAQVQALLERAATPRRDDAAHPHEARCRRLAERFVLSAAVAWAKEAAA